MKLLARLFGWASVFALPCYLVMKPYQEALASFAMRILQTAGAPAQVQVDLHEPFGLGLYAAMCLASHRCPLYKRIRAVFLGAPILGAFGLVAVLAFVVANRLTTGHAGGDQGGGSRFIASTLETVPWLSAPALWALFLGRWELPAATIGTPSSLKRGERGLRTG